MNKIVRYMNFHNMVFGLKHWSKVVNGLLLGSINASDILKVLQQSKMVETVFERGTGKNVIKTSLIAIDTPIHM